MATLDQTPLRNQRRAVTADYAAKMLANQRGRTLSQQRGQRQRADFTRGFKQQVPQFAASYGNRGLANSGVYKRAMGEFVGGYTRDLGRMQEDAFNTDQQFQSEADMLTASRDRELANLEMTKASEIANTARFIAELQKVIGGFS